GGGGGGCGFAAPAVPTAISRARAQAVIRVDFLLGITALVASTSSSRRPTLQKEIDTSSLTAQRPLLGAEGVSLGGAGRERNPAGCRLKRDRLPSFSGRGGQRDGRGDPDGRTSI